MSPIDDTVCTNVATISYVCDLADSRPGNTIPLAVLVEVRVRDFRGVGVRSRRELKSTELEKITGVMQSRLQEPARIVESVFDDVVEASSETTITSIPSRYRNSLRVDLISVNDSVALPEIVQTGSDAQLNDWLEAQVADNLENFFGSYCGSKRSLLARPEPVIEKAKRHILGLTTEASQTPLRSSEGKRYKGKKVSVSELISESKKLHYGRGLETDAVTFSKVESSLGSSKRTSSSGG